MNGPAVEADGLRKTFGQVTALDRLSFQVPQGSLLGLLGPVTRTVTSWRSSPRPPEPGHGTQGRGPHPRLWPHGG